MGTNIIHSVQYFDGKFPKGTLKKAIEHKDEVIPELLAILEYTCENAEALAKDEDYFGHIYAIYLLAQFREQRAYPLICSLLRQPYEVLNTLLDDVITEGLPSILASVFDGDRKPLYRIIENEEIDQFIRSAALDAIVVLMAQGVITREEVLEYFSYLFHGGLERKPSFIWDALVLNTNDIHPGEMIQEIKSAYDEGLVDPTTIGFKEIEEQLQRSKQEVLHRLQNDPHRQFINDTIRELESWACFNPNTDFRISSFPVTKNFNMRPTGGGGSNQPYRVGLKVGRNDPCPCGSGKKYKKCCGKNI